MSDGSMVPEQTRYHDRANRILNVAGALLLQWGYKRVTMDDIAERSEIGKGTLYLHWKSKQVLFQTLLLREMVRLWRALLHQIEGQPTTAYLSELFPALLVALEERPLARALFTGDQAVLGKLVSGRADRAVASQDSLASTAFLTLLRDVGLLRRDQPLTLQQYALQATITGFFLIPPESGSLDKRVAALRYVLQQSFEPTPPLDEGALQNAIALLQDWMEALCQSVEQQIRVLSGLAHPSPSGGDS